MPYFIEFPTYRIENINIDLDIRPVEEQPTEAQPGKPNKSHNKLI